MGKEFTNLKSALTSAFEFPVRGHHRPFVIELRTLRLEGNRLSRFGLKAWLMIETIALGESTRHVAEDDMLGFRLEVSRSRAKR